MRWHREGVAARRPPVPVDVHAALSTWCSSSNHAFLGCHALPPAPKSSCPGHGLLQHRRARGSRPGRSAEGAKAGPSKQLFPFSPREMVDLCLCFSPRLPPSAWPVQPESWADSLKKQAGARVAVPVSETSGRPPRVPFPADRLLHAPDQNRTATPPGPGRALGAWPPSPQTQGTRPLLPALTSPSPAQVLSQRQPRSHNLVLAGVFIQGLYLKGCFCSK